MRLGVTLTPYQCPLAQVDFTKDSPRLYRNPHGYGEEGSAAGQKINRDEVGLTLQLIHEIKSGNYRRLPKVLKKIKFHMKLALVGCQPYAVYVRQRFHPARGFLQEELHSVTAKPK